MKISVQFLAGFAAACVSAEDHDTVVPNHLQDLLSTSKIVIKYIGFSIGILT